MNVGERIKEARKAHGLTQAELGEKVGLQKSAISKWERGETQNIKRSTLVKLSEILELQPVELIQENPCSVVPSVINHFQGSGRSNEKKVVQTYKTLAQDSVVLIDGEPTKKESSEATAIVEIYEQLNQHNKNRLIEYMQQLLTEQHTQVLARINRLKK